MSEYTKDLLVRQIRRLKESLDEVEIDQQQEILAEIERLERDLKNAN
jgi:hypothetical protein